MLTKKPFVNYLKLSKKMTEYFTIIFLIIFESNKLKVFDRIHKSYKIIFITNE